MALKRVFYEEWQMGCCGEPFSVGDEIHWPLVDLGERQILDGDCHGAEARVENHADAAHPTGGRVRAIDLVHQEYTVDLDLRDLGRTPPPYGRLTLLPAAHSPEPVPGSVTLEPVDHCPKWFAEEDYAPPQGPHRVRRAQGALVTLEVPDGAPHQPGDRR
ncbi:DUF6578 domain-containing protein [Streptomyces cellostaticus]|uniref:DUF6578 domain-containing protein n=1 Tax=Streptomyces cellostaticus TaxID=67285 RepID=UPI0020275017|nr:DUF6578 domain-containing protein [Streptomyces cellostaticus]